MVAKNAILYKKGMGRLALNVIHQRSKRVMMGRRLTMGHTLIKIASSRTQGLNSQMNGVNLKKCAKNSHLRSNFRNANTEIFSNNHKSIKNDQKSELDLVRNLKTLNEGIDEISTILTIKDRT